MSLNVDPPFALVPDADDLSHRHRTKRARYNHTPRLQMPLHTSLPPSHPPVPNPPFLYVCCTCAYMSEELQPVMDHRAEYRHMSYRVVSEPELQQALAGIIAKKENAKDVDAENAGPAGKTGDVHATSDSAKYGAVGGAGAETQLEDDYELDFKVINNQMQFVPDLAPVQGTQEDDDYEMDVKVVNNHMQFVPDLAPVQNLQETDDYEMDFKVVNNQMQFVPDLAPVQRTQNEDDYEMDVDMVNNYLQFVPDLAPVQNLQETDDYEMDYKIVDNQMQFVPDLAPVQKSRVQDQLEALESL
ncbi:hypothetical protein EDC01DRAFT_757100 [Geopyxis carbonaria]|nr:hypothetical protein EDC01DRAFT_757100 [Geopyxis carbonaria]